jgi:hypothetical protein
MGCRDFDSGGRCTCGSTTTSGSPAFVEAHRDQCHVVHADNLAIEGPRLIERMRAEGVPLLADADVADLIQPNLLRHGPSASIERYCRRRSAESNALMQRLGVLSRGEAGAHHGAGDGGG